MDQVMELEKQEVEAPEGVERTRNRQVYVPRVDIYETADNIVLLADMPGVDQESIDITLEKNILTITGYIDWRPPENFELAYAEYRVGDYHRTFALSDEVDRDGIEATMRNGVLRLVLPKSAEARMRKIAVKTAS